MSLLKSPLELAQEVEPVMALICGETNTGKSTLAATAPRPFAIEADSSSKRVDALHMVDTLRLTDWSDAIKLFSGRDTDGYESVILDPLGKIIDVCFDWSLRQRGVKGTMQAYGEVKKQMLWLLRTMKARNLHIICTLHADVIDMDGNKQIKPVAAGKSFINYVYEADVLCLLHKREQSRYLAVHPFNDNGFTAKGNEILGDEVLIPEIKKGQRHDTFQRLILDPYYKFHKNRAAVLAKEAAEYKKLTDQVDNMLSVVSDPESCTECFKELKKMPQLVTLYWQNQLRELKNARGWQWNKDKERFEVAQ